MRRALAGATVALVAAVSVASAHKVPARRTVVVQADDGGLAVLVTWTSARGPQGAQMLARAAWGRSERALVALRGIAGAEALRGLEITVDGKPVKNASISIKVRIDQRSPARVVAVALVTLPPQAGVYRVRAQSGATTQMTWRDKTAGQVRSALAPGRWLGDRRTLRLLVPTLRRPAR